jgi:hypothetical protein
VEAGPAGEGKEAPASDLEDGWGEMGRGTATVGTGHMESCTERGDGEAERLRTAESEWVSRDFMQRWCGER